MDFRIYYRAKNGSMHIAYARNSAASIFMATSIIRQGCIVTDLFRGDEEVSLSGLI